MLHIPVVSTFALSWREHGQALVTWMKDLFFWRISCDGGDEDGPCRVTTRHQRLRDIGDVEGVLSRHGNLFEVKVAEDGGTYTEHYCNEHLREFVQSHSPVKLMPQGEAPRRDDRPS